MAPRSRVRWFALVAVLVAAGVAVLFRGVLGSGDEAQTGLSGQLAERVVTILEQATPEEHAHHGHHFEEDAGIVCAAEPFGFEPAGAASVAQVERVYTLHMCAVTGTGLPWQHSVRAAGPIVVELSDPPQVILPATGDNHHDEIRKIIPEQHHEAALVPGGVTDGLSEQLRRRLDAAQS